MVFSLTFCLQTIVAAYSQLRASMFEQGSERAIGPLQRLRFEARRRHCYLASAGIEAELYLTFDPVVDKMAALRICGALHGWLRGRLDQLF
jgi:hypothetical protein